MFCWIAARADLTEADLRKISSMFDTKFDKLQSELSKLESRFDDFQQTTSKAFQRLYGFKGEQIEVMRSVSSRAVHPKGSETQHAL